ncbi:unnamed protein product [Moneuplotes crassus]|uniref:Uncharacterized protein n=1 Tax=Euplotes crassus TaxID=5936 RepID=A0AAD1UPF3_EUPCR|nr:unnamed protein product [Moneuplotes crassus]
MNVLYLYKRDEEDSEIEVYRKENYFAETMITAAGVYTMYWFESLKIQLNVDLEVVYKNAAYCRCKKIYKIPKNNQYNVYMTKYLNDPALSFPKMMKHIERANINCLMLIKNYEPKRNDINNVVRSTVKLMCHSLNILFIERFYVKKRQFNLIIKKLHQVRFVSFARCAIEFSPRKIESKIRSRFSKILFDHVNNVLEEDEFLTYKPVLNFCRAIRDCSLAWSLRKFKVYPGFNRKMTNEISEECDLGHVDFITYEKSSPGWDYF